MIRATAGAGGLAALALARCAGSDGGGAAPQPSKGPVTLRVHIQTGNYTDFTKKWGDLYKQEKPNVTVVVEPFPTANQEYHTKIKTLHVTGSIGDMAWTWATQGLLPEFGHLKIWRPVDDLVRAERFDLKQYFPAIAEGMIFEGKLMGLPFHGHPGFPFFFYNAELFAKRGVQPPTNTWTLETLIDVGKRLTEQDAGGGSDTWGWFSVAGYHGLIVLARMFGGDLLSADGKTSELTSPRTRQAIQWVVDARLRHRMEPTPDQLAGQGNINDLFAQGRFGMMHGDSAQVSTMHTRIRGRFTWDIAMLPPGVPGAQRGALTTPHIMGITTQSQQVADAWGFLKSYTGKEAGVVKALDGAGVPGGRPDAWNDPRILSGVPQYKALAQAFDWARPERTPANFRGLEVSSLIDQELAPIFAGKEGAEAGTTRASTMLQALLDRAPG